MTAFLQKLLPSLLLLLIGGAGTLLVSSLSWWTHDHEADVRRDEQAEYLRQNFEQEVKDRKDEKLMIVQWLDSIERRLAERH